MPEPERGANEAGPAGHLHVWQPYEDADDWEACGVWGCGVDRKCTEPADEGGWTEIPGVRSFRRGP